MEPEYVVLLVVSHYIFNWLHGRQYSARLAASPCIAGRQFAGPGRASCGRLRSCGLARAIAAVCCLLPGTGDERDRPGRERRQRVGIGRGRGRSLRRRAAASLVAGPEDRGARPGGRLSRARGAGRARHADPPASHGAAGARRVRQDDPACRMLPPAARRRGPHRLGFRGRSGRARRSRHLHRLRLPVRRSRRRCRVGGPRDVGSGPAGGSGGSPYRDCAARDCGSRRAVRAGVR